jgi:hypothetical protein
MVDEHAMAKFKTEKYNTVKNHAVNLNMAMYGVRCATFFIFLKREFDYLKT